MSLEILSKQITKHFLNEIARVVSTEKNRQKAITDYKGQIAKKDVASYASDYGINHLQHDDLKCDVISCVFAAYFNTQKHFESATNKDDVESILRKDALSMMPSLVKSSNVILIHNTDQDNEEAIAVYRYINKNAQQQAADIYLPNLFEKACDKAMEYKDEISLAGLVVGVSAVFIAGVKALTSNGPSLPGPKI